MNLEDGNIQCFFFFFFFFTSDAGKKSNCISAHSNGVRRMKRWPNITCESLCEWVTLLFLSFCNGTHTNTYLSLPVTSTLTAWYVSRAQPCGPSATAATLKGILVT